ncbi:MAG TPA: hypothetical protein VKX16_12920, partial [Chloroflexota bacterium]|nr:hypothetical protein [Chloroflexota bacterium]
MFWWEVEWMWSDRLETMLTILLSAGAILLGLVALFVMLDVLTRQTSQELPQARSPSGEILDRRLARGEIDLEELARRLAALGVPLTGARAV